jgi:hypothetical protein
MTGFGVRRIAVQYHHLSWEDRGAVLSYHLSWKDRGAVLSSFRRREGGNVKGDWDSSKG